MILWSEMNVWFKGGVDITPWGIMVFSATFNNALYLSYIVADSMKK